MSLISRSLVRNWWDDIDRYHREIEDHFRRLNLRDQDLWQIPSVRETFRPWRTKFENLEKEIGGWATVDYNNDRYQIIVDVQQFTPEEVTVRTDDKFITVEARAHERKDKYGYVSRQFIRRYLLPKGYDISLVKPSLSSDGILTITAPRLVLPALGERTVPIRRSFWPAIKAT